MKFIANICIKVFLFPMQVLVLYGLCRTWTGVHIASLCILVFPFRCSSCAKTGINTTWKAVFCSSKPRPGSTQTNLKSEFFFLFTVHTDNMRLQKCKQSNRQQILSVLHNKTVFVISSQIKMSKSISALRQWGQHDAVHHVWRFGAIIYYIISKHLLSILQYSFKSYG